MDTVANNLRKIIRAPSQGPLVSLSKWIDVQKAAEDGFEFDIKNIYELINEQDQEILQIFRRIYRDYLWEDNESLTSFPKNSKERRDKINELLELPSEIIKILDVLIKFGEPEHTQTFSKKPSYPWVQEYDSQYHYWNTFKRHLKEKKLKNNPKHGEIIKELDESSNAILDFLEPPVTEKPYQTKGLVVGHVQSGKTQHMEAVVSKAIDCGYKIIIILTGRNTLLRQQTQKRFDQDIFGKEIIHPDITDWSEVVYDEDQESRDYFDDPTFQVAYDDPKSSFVSHGFAPSASTGSILVKRVTDYTENGLPSGRMPSSPYTFQGDNSEENLKNTPAHFAAINKTTGSIKRLITMLERAGTESLKHMPALIIDDESDSASITPYTESDDEGVRNEEDLQATNKIIRKLLKTLPRAQYLAYTATPYANVFITSDDKDDLFPKDFIALLKTPEDYMGPKSFISEDLEQNFLHPDFSNFVRDAILSDEESSIQNALDAFLLSGAIKLYRENHLGLSYGDKFAHHTMLVHTSHKNKEQEEMADKFQEVWDNGDYTSQGLKRLEKLYNEDFLPTNKLVDSYKEENELPENFNKIKPFINTARTFIEEAPSENSDNIYILINQDNPAPGFSKTPGEHGVWKILTGGNMLSRGYTIPDLTISYFTRVVTAGDTLEQMARWFGYRPDYKDLVRVYFARDARAGTRDIYEEFVDICKTESGLRELLSNLPETKDERFSRDLSPVDFALYVVQEGRVPPTAAQKMRNVGTVSENFGGRLFDKSQSFPTQGTKQDKHNNKLFTNLISSIELEKKEFSFSNTKPREFWVADIESKLVENYLSEFQWTLEDPTKVLKWFLGGNLTCPKSRKNSDYFIPTHSCEPAIDNWKILINKGDTKLKEPYSTYKFNNYEFTVAGRSPHKTQGWNTLESGNDTKFVHYIFSKEKGEHLGNPNDVLRTEFQKRTAIIHGYLVDNLKNPTGKPSFGWTLRIPDNDCRKEIKLIPANQLSYEQA